MPFVTTPGATDANSYASVAEADAYNDSRPFTETWGDLDSSQKEAALIEATRLLDAVFQWTGAATDPANQALTWPRIGMFNRNGYLIASNVIPLELKNAECELSRRIADEDLTEDLVQDVEGLSALKVGPVEIKFRDKSGSSSSSSATSLTMLDAELRQQNPEFYFLDRVIPSDVRMLLVPSWYLRASILRKPIIKAFL